MAEWISVKDRLPEEKGSYLVVTSSMRTWANMEAVLTGLPDQHQVLHINSLFVLCMKGVRI